MITDFDKILNELSYRVNDGTPDLTNEQHLMKLYEVLKEHNWPIESRVQLIKNLSEAEEVVVKPHADSKLVRKLGASNKVTDERVNGIGTATVGNSDATCANFYIVE